MSIVPKVSKKLAIRTSICLFILAAIFAAYNWLKSNRDIGNFSTADTHDMILAIQTKADGTQAVIVKPDGSILPSPEYRDGITDRDPVWRPDGKVVFFSSDRKAKNYNIYRWNLQHNIIEKRSIGTRSQLATYFGSPALGATNDAALITAGGFVLLYNPTDTTTYQMLPPIGKGASASAEEGGVGSQFEATYERLGNSFKSAKWGKDHAFIFAVMRGEVGEVLMVQPMNDDRPPMVIAAGERIDFDVNPDTGEVLFTVLGFRIADIDKDLQLSQVSSNSGKPVEAKTKAQEKLKIMKEALKIRHRIGIFDPSRIGEQGSVRYIAISQTDKMCFSNPRISPDGSGFVVTTGAYAGSGNVNVTELNLVTGSTPSTMSKSVLVKGPVNDPCWHPSSQKLTFTMAEKDGNRSVYVVDRDGNGLKNLTQGKGNFSRPLFSPQSQ